MTINSTLDKMADDCSSIQAESTIPDVDFQDDADLKTEDNDKVLATTEPTTASFITVNAVDANTESNRDTDNTIAKRGIATPDKAIADANTESNRDTDNTIAKKGIATPDKAIADANTNATNELVDEKLITTNAGFNKSTKNSTAPESGFISTSNEEYVNTVLSGLNSVGKAPTTNSGSDINRQATNETVSFSQNILANIKCEPVDDSFNNIINIKKEVYSDDEDKMEYNDESNVYSSFTEYNIKQEPEEQIDSEQSYCQFEEYNQNTLFSDYSNIRTQQTSDVDQNILRNMKCEPVDQQFTYENEETNFHSVSPLYAANYSQNALFPDYSNTRTQQTSNDSQYNTEYDMSVYNTNTHQVDSEKYVNYNILKNIKCEPVDQQVYENEETNFNSPPPSFDDN